MSVRNLDSVQVDSFPVSNTEGMWVVCITDPSSRAVLSTVSFPYRPTMTDIVDALNARELADRTSDRTDLIRDWTVEQCDYFVREEERLLSMGLSEEQAEQVAYFEAAKYYEQEKGAEA